MKHSRNSVTSIEVAKLAGVSQSSVSRAFSHEGPVSVKTRRKVLDAARKLGYQPNAMARSLITRRTSMVGMVIANVHNNPFYTEVLDLLSRKFQKLGQKVMLFIVNRDQNMDDILPQLLEYQVEGNPGHRGDFEFDDGQGMRTLGKAGGDDQPLRSRILRKLVLLCQL